MIVFYGRIFFRDDYRYHAQPETRASFVSAGDSVGLEVYASRRLNDFYSNTDRVEVSIDGYRQQLWSSPFFYENRSAFSYLEQQGVDELAEEEEAFRAWSEHTLYYPNRWGRFRWFRVSEVDLLITQQH